MDKMQDAIILGRRRIVLGLTGLIGIMVTGCSLNGPTSSNQTSSTPQPTTSATAIPTPIARGTTLYTYTQHTRQVDDIAWSPDSKYIVSVSNGLDAQRDSDDVLSQLYKWDASTGASTPLTFENPFLFGPLAWSPDGKMIALSSSQQMNEVPIFILNAQTWKQEASFNIPSYGPTPAQLTWSPDSSHLAAAGANRVAIFSLSTQAITLSYPSDSTVSQPSNVVAWSPGDNIIASAAADDGHSLQFWNAITGEPLYYFLGAKPDVAVWSPEGKTIATGNTFAQPPQILASDTARVILNFQDKLPSFGKPQLIGNYLWQYPHTISWSPDGKYIAVATDQHKVQIWDVANKGLIYTYGEHTNWISAVAWSPDGTRVASSSYDKTVRVWQAL